MIQMIQNSIASRGRGKSLLSAIVLALFVFGVIQMLSNGWLVLIWLASEHRFSELDFRRVRSKPLSWRQQKPLSGACVLITHRFWPLCQRTGGEHCRHPTCTMCFQVSIAVALETLRIVWGAGGCGRTQLYVLSSNHWPWFTDTSGLNCTTSFCSPLTSQPSTSGFSSVSSEFVRRISICEILASLGSQTALHVINSAHSGAAAKPIMLFQIQVSLLDLSPISAINECPPYSSWKPSF